ncbi:hypothetical protein KFL_009700020 [Klebsormidium nitens]|uniref:Acid phosphatase/vanadium-dependent haloperoxidase-related protein n=1 Tax=Klebsormidium nitens TaxID=105231 RepID=A0A1Y1IN10_KLENI|nr:hypothetical protein KFL_009700020 [Klebsormidium nitens]|eukprot:GAQ92295.1 hypothetical protein KFL_009700020 [Klebsormidium nitens]
MALVVADQLSIVDSLASLRTDTRRRFSQRVTLAQTASKAPARASPFCHPLITNSAVKRKCIWQSRSFSSSWLAGTTPSRDLCARRALPEEAKERRASGVRAALSGILHNEVLVTTAAACVLCQGLKPFAALAEGKPLNWRLVYKSGGMPSSHTSSVTALATAVGLERGLDDDLFAICVVLACIVMYDAQGVRYAVGKQAEVLNSLVIPQISEPPAKLLDEAEQREAPQAEKMLVANTSKHASTSQTGPSGRWVETAAGRPGSERDTWRESSGRASQSDRATRSVTDKLEEALSAPEGAAWIKRMNVEGGEGVSKEEEWSYSPAYRSKDVRESNGAGDVARRGESFSEGRGLAEGYPKAWRHVPLKEAVGHSKLEVAVGGVAGVVLAFAFHATVFGGRL